MAVPTFRCCRPAASRFKTVRRSLGDKPARKDPDMRRIALLAAICAAVLVSPAPLHGQFNASLRPREEQQVRQWYNDYLGREVGPELRAWVELLKSGMSPLDVQATILGSDEFFNQKGRDTQSFVIETLQSVTWEEP